MLKIAVALLFCRILLFELASSYDSFIAKSFLLIFGVIFKWSAFCDYFSDITVFCLVQVN